MRKTADSGSAKNECGSPAVSKTCSYTWTELWMPLSWSWWTRPANMQSPSDGIWKNGQKLNNETVFLSRSQTAGLNFLADARAKLLDRIHLTILLEWKPLSLKFCNPVMKLGTFLHILLDFLQALARLLTNSNLNCQHYSRSQAGV